MKEKPCILITLQNEKCHKCIGYVKSSGNDKRESDRVFGYFEGWWAKGYIS
jgi:hypothetical protein